MIAARLSEARDEMRATCAGATELRPEWPFAVRLGNEAGPRVIVDGIIDLVYRNRSGVWQVVDYKLTDDSASALQKKYGLQLSLYAEAVRRWQNDPSLDVRAAVVAIGRDQTRHVAVEIVPDAETAAIQAAGGLRDVLTAS